MIQWLIKPLFMEGLTAGVLTIPTGEKAVAPTLEADVPSGKEQEWLYPGD